MEAELGFTLFNRGKNGVTMTSYGASLYPSIRAVRNSDEALQQSIARLNGLEKGKVKLGAFNSICSGLLPSILKGFMDHYPQIEVEVYQGTYDDVKEWLRTGQVDIAFLSNNCREEFVLTELFHEPLLCITPMDWPEPPNGVMTPALMNGQNFVVQWDATDAEMRQFLKKYSLSTERRCHVIDDQSNIAMVEAGLGISIMPRMLLRNCTAAVKIYPIEPEEDRVVGEEPFFLPAATEIFLWETPKLVSSCDGVCYPAHIDRPSGGLPFILGDFPPDFPFEVYELHDCTQKTEFEKRYPLLKEKYAVCSSDAHHPEQIRDASHRISLDGQDEGTLRQSLFCFLRNPVETGEEKQR